MLNLDVRELTRNAIRDLCDPNLAAQTKNQTFIVQPVEVKVFTEEDNKKNIKQR